MSTNKSQDEQKKLVAMAVAEALKKLPLDDMVLGIGTGSTLNIFIQTMPDEIKRRIRKPVAVSSIASQEMLAAHSIDYEADTNMINGIDLYIDGADEVDEHGRMIKGGGGALTGEKILASQSKDFWCLVDQSKLVPVLGNFPVAVEVTNMARSLVSREILKLGGSPEYREGFVSDHSNPIVDVYGLDLTEPLQVEEKINNLPGVVANGIFARDRASKIFVATDSAVKELTPAYID